MKTLLLLLVLLLSSRGMALNIYSANISAISATAINVSLTTEAEELYYYHSWQYAVSGNTILLEVCYVSGFGSTMSYLNNNFEIPLDTATPAVHVIQIKIYYTNLVSESQELQDETIGRFATPLTNVLTVAKTECKHDDVKLFPNPTHGNLYIGSGIKNIFVFDQLGRKVTEFLLATGIVNLAALQQGVYFVRVQQSDYDKTSLIILKQ